MVAGRSPRPPLLQTAKLSPPAQRRSARMPAASCAAWCQVPRRRRPARWSRSEPVDLDAPLGSRFTRWSSERSSSPACGHEEPVDEHRGAVVELAFAPRVAVHRHSSLRVGPRRRCARAGQPRSRRLVAVASTRAGRRWGEHRGEPWRVWPALDGDRASKLVAVAERAVRHDVPTSPPSGHGGEHVAHPGRQDHPSSPVVAPAERCDGEAGSEGMSASAFSSRSSTGRSATVCRAAPRNSPDPCGRV